MSVRRWPLFVALIGLTQTASSQTRAPFSAPATLTAFDRAKAETLLRSQLPCLGCHALGNEGGKLAPDLATVRERRDADYIARVVMDPQVVAAGSFMPHTPMAAASRALLVRYLGGNDALVSRVQVPTKAQVADSNGALLYARFCTGCHGPGGGGDGPNAKSLPVPPARHADREAMSARPDDALYDTIAGGGAIMNRSPRMPAYGTTLTPAQIRGLVRHIRSLCRCSGPSWSTDGSGPAVTPPPSAP